MNAIKENQTNSGPKRKILSQVKKCLPNIINHTFVPDIFGLGPFSTQTQFSCTHPDIINQVGFELNMKPGFTYQVRIEVNLRPTGIIHQVGYESGVWTLPRTRKISSMNV